MPRGLAFAGGDLIFVEEGNGTVRRVDPTLGLVGTIAGAPAQPGAVDGVYTDARFSTPRGIVAGPGGSVFVADESNRTIRRIDLATRAVTTVAGRAGQADLVDDEGIRARFLGPVGLATDDGTTLFVADRSSIRKVVVSTGSVSTLAGSSQGGAQDGIGADASFTWLSGLAHDGAGNLFAADIRNASIRKIVVATREVTTLAGGGIPGGPSASFSVPVGMAADRVGHVFVSDADTQTIHKIVIATGVVTTLAGARYQTGFADGVGAAARFSQPVGLAWSSDGTLLVADMGNHVIRRIDVQSGAVSTVVGTGVGGVRPGPLPGGLNRPSAISWVGNMLAIVDEEEQCILLARP